MDFVPRLILLVLIAILPLVAVQTYNAEKMRWDERRRVDHEAAHLAGDVAMAQDRIIEGARELLVGIADVMGPARTAAAACDALFDGMRSGFPQYLELYAVSADGAALCKSGAVPEGDVAGRSYFNRVLREKRFVVGEYGRARGSGGAGLEFAAPILDARMDTIGIVVAGLSLDWLATYLNFVPIPTGSSIFVADRSGTVLVATDRPSAVGRKLPDEYRFLASAERGGAAAVGTAPSGPRTVGYLTLAVEDGDPRVSGPADLAVAVTVDPRPHLAAIDSSVRHHVLATAASALLAFIMALLLSRWTIARPMARMLAATERWIAGDYRARTGIEPDVVEFRSLGNRLEQMAGQFGERETRLRDVGEARRRLLAIAGHDLRQPLQSISAFLERLKRQPGTAPDQAALERADRALSRVTRALDAVSDVARIESDALKPQRTVFPADELLADIEDEWSPGAAAKGLRLRIVICRHLVETDRMMMRAVAGNLVGNAVRYTERGGIVVGFRHCGDRLRFQVIDTGIGMAEDKLDSVFEAFHQLAPGKGPGMGLGLWIVKRSTEELGHPLVMRSILGRGTSFSIEIPRAAGSAGEAPAAEA